MAATPNLITNRAAFLDMIAWAEIGSALLSKSENGYNVLVGSTPDKPLLFSSYADHPRILNQKLHSTAAGRYQLLAHWYDAYKRYLHLPDFSPVSQDAIALQQIKEQGAIPDIDNGNIEDAIAKCSNIWASLPGNDYEQPTRTLNDLILAFHGAGGYLA